MIVLPTPPTPPNMLVPPMTVAAMTHNSMPWPRFGVAKSRRAVCTMPARPAVRAADAIEDNDIELDRNTGQPGDLAVAANGIGVESEPRRGEDKARITITARTVMMTGPTNPAPSHLNWSGKRDISLPMPIILATPLAAIIMPSVATSVGTPIMTMTKPLIRPHRVPAPRPPRTATHQGRPARSSCR